MSAEILRVLQAAGVVTCILCAAEAEAANRRAWSFYWTFAAIVCLVAVSS